MEDWVAQLADYARTALRPLDGKLEAAGLTSEVEVLTDRWGVPHVYAHDREDLYFAQGYLHAAERLWQVDVTRRLAQGRLAEVLGEFALPFDRFFRTLGLGRTARSWLDRMDDNTRRVGLSYHAGFAAGARAFPKPVEYQILALEPEIPGTLEEGVLTTFAIALLMAFALSPNWEFELLRLWLARALDPERAARLAPLVGAETPSALPPSASVAGLVRALTEAARQGGAAPGAGSNNWVVSGARSVTGKPLLANDPHLKIQMPSLWMEMHLACPDLEAAGATLPGAPGILIGHNRRIAWGFTNTQADVADLYLERVSPDGSEYEHAGEWHPVEVVREEIFVRHEPEPRAHEVRLTRHGPLLTSTIQGNLNPQVREGVVGDALAFRWIHHDVVSSQRSVEGINCASNWQEFREAAREWTSPGQNMVYADIDGNIGYQFTGVVPVRAAGRSGAAPAPGWTGEHEWEGEIPFDELPSSFNPESGFVATANHRIVDLDYPRHLTDDWEPPHRIRRIVALLTEKERLSAEDFARIQTDTHSGMAEELVPLLLTAEVHPGRAAEARRLVEGWDRRLDPESQGAAVFIVWCSKVAEGLFRPALGDELFDFYFRVRGWTTLWAFDAMGDLLAHPEAEWVGGSGSDNPAARDALVARALEEACDELEARLGADPAGWRWGRLHRVHFRHALTTAMPPLDELMSSGPFEAPGGDDTINRGVFNPGEDYGDAAVASYRQIIDLSDFDRSLSVITGGNSGNPASPHYRDQSEMWLRGEYHPMPFTRGAVEAAAAGTLVLVPET